MDTDRYVDLGHLLRGTREALGLTLDEIEQRIHIRTRYLEAMENGRFDELPSPIQVRGFLQNYSEYLGLEPDDVLLHYAEGIQAKVRNQNPDRPTLEGGSFLNRLKWPGMSGPGWLNSDLFLIITMVLVLTAALIWGGTRMFAEVRMDSAPVSVDTLQTTAVEATPEPQPAFTESTTAAISMVLLTPSETPTLPLMMNTTSGVGVTIVIERSTWIRVLVDGEEVAIGRYSPGAVLEYRGETVVEVAAGNAGGVRIFYGGEDQGIMGDLDQAVTRIWTLDGMITPTPVVTETSTPTASPTITPTADLTQSLSPGLGNPDRQGD